MTSKRVAKSGINPVSTTIVKASPFDVSKCKYALDKNVWFIIINYIVAPLYGSHGWSCTC